ncbi:Dabb family protein [Curtobacterium sp. ME26]|uniref:Dabb family protein n=1 Tax=Curtobacterium sp. ME26 TaxID=2744254 RepID=UPI0015F5444A|nr:Dabb family protein [Curtobacterium sp. ME26]
MITHTVSFTLVHEPDSAGESAFIRAARDTISAIPGVRDFTINRQISRQSNFRFQFTMRFTDQAAYDSYNAHPDHQEFVATNWTREVSRFEELDFVPYAVP